LDLELDGGQHGHLGGDDRLDAKVGERTPESIFSPSSSHSKDRHDVKNILRRKS
jgi:hypothetical protein